MEVKDYLDNSISNQETRKESKNRFVDKYEFYEHIQQNRNHIIVNNAINSILVNIDAVFEVIKGLEDVPKELEDLSKRSPQDLAALKKVIKKYFPDIVTFFDC